MSSDIEEDLFADSSSDGDDTTELISEAKKKNKKNQLKTKKVTQRLSRKSSKKETVSDDEAAALFDSDSEDEAPTKQDLSSKKSRMEALQAKRREAANHAAAAKTLSKKKKTKDATVPAPKEQKDHNNKNKEDGYDSGDSYDSGVFVRTKEDDDFIDAEGEDPDALRELYAEQHFDDERGYDSFDEQKKTSESGKKKKRSRTSSSRPDAWSDDGDDELDEMGQPKNPILAVVQRMKKKKKESKKLEELEQLAQTLVRRMSDAADEDDMALRQRKPATKKIILLPEVLNMITLREMWRPLLDADLLTVSGVWVQPLPNGSLGNVTVRQKLIDAIGKMTGEKGVSTDDLKKSGFGKILMKLYMHKDETPDVKRLAKSLIDSWSRPIFQKSENLRDLDTSLAYGRRGDTGIVGISKAYYAQEKGKESLLSTMDQVGPKDLSTVLSKSVKVDKDLGTNRVRVPYSKGFQYTVRPSNLDGDVSDKLTRSVNVKDSRESLHKRMLQKTRPVAKNQRSANISIEGRPVK